MKTVYLKQPVLVTRELGSNLRERLDSVLSEEDTRVLVVDFSAVDILDFSSADEAVGKVCNRLVAGEYGDKYLVVKGLKPHCQENLEVALRQRQLVVPCCQDRGYSVIGDLKPHLQEVLDLVLCCGSVTARRVARQLIIAGNTASNRLYELFRLRLVTRWQEPLASGGSQFVYSTII